MLYRSAAINDLSGGDLEPAPVVGDGGADCVELGRHGLVEGRQACRAELGRQTKAWPDGTSEITAIADRRSEVRAG